MNKTPNYLLMVIVGLVVNLITIIPASADDGQLMEAYPPNYEAKNFKLSDLSGEMHELEDYRGKHVLVNFWSMSCNVCKSEMTTLQSAHELLDREDLVIVSIHAGDPSEGVESVLKLNNINYPVLFDIDLQFHQILNQVFQDSSYHNAEPLVYRVKEYSYPWYQQLRSSSINPTCQPYLLLCPSYKFH